MDTLTLSDGHSEVVVAPAKGGGLAAYDRLDGNERMPLFLSSSSPERPAPFDLAFNVLVPWSGRISGGGFRHEDRFHALAPNFAPEPLPIHGNGFSSPWEVAEAEQTRVRLTLCSNEPGPYRYDGEIAYTLENGALRITLAVTHKGEGTLPYGLGFHPWFPRDAGTRLLAPAEMVTLEDSRHLPAGQLAVATRPDWDFGAPRRLPGAWINNDFSPWAGRATITWDDRGLALDIEADPMLGTYILYSPCSDADFFCFEPVTHPVDAHNRPGGPATNGLAVLSRGETLRASCLFTPRML